MRGALGCAGMHRYWQAGDQWNAQPLPSFREARRLVQRFGDLAGNNIVVITQPELPTDVECVRVMSLHKSKGLTADFVVVADCIEGSSRASTEICLRSTKTSAPRAAETLLRRHDPH
jgi:superfamily I DNA/RNA helicase